MFVALFALLFTGCGQEKVVSIERRVPRTRAVAPVKKGQAQLVLLSTSVSPDKAAPGETVSLIVEYTLTDLAENETMPVREARYILKDGQQIISPMLDSKLLGCGRYISRKTLPIPPNIAPGEYLVVTVLNMAHFKAQKSTVLIITAR